MDLAKADRRAVPWMGLKNVTLAGRDVAEVVPPFALALEKRVRIGLEVGAPSLEDRACLRTGPRCELGGASGLPRDGVSWPTTMTGRE